jgi:hypothetical protein
MLTVKRLTSDYALFQDKQDILRRQHGQEVMASVNQSKVNKGFLDQHLRDPLIQAIKRYNTN